MDSVRGLASPAPKPVDVDELLARCLGRVELVDRILNRFHQTFAEDVKRLEDAVQASKADEVARIAHRIKGACLAVSAPALTSCAGSLEVMASEGQWTEIPAQLSKLKQEGSRFDDLSSLLPARMAT